MIVKREESVNRLVRLMGNGNVKVITGIRRCGKGWHRGLSPIGQVDC